MSGRKRPHQEASGYGRRPQSNKDDGCRATPGIRRPSSGNNGRLLYCRAIILLTSCCSNIMRAFILQTVKKNDPEDGEEYTLDRFLNDRAASFYRSLVTGKRRRVNQFQEEILYLRPQGIEEWDLSLLAYVGMEMCNLPHSIRMDFELFKSVRNGLFHSAGGEVTEEDYDLFIDQMKVAYERLLGEIEDVDVQQNLADAFEETQKENECLQYEVYHKQVSEWIENDNPINDKIDLTGEGPGEIQKLIQGLVDDKKEAKVDPEIIDIIISIVVKNVGAREERFIIKTLLTHLDPDAAVTILDRDSSLDIGEGTESTRLQDVGPAIEEAIQDLLANDREVANVQYGCKVRIKCHSYEGLNDLVRKVIQGEVTKAFEKVEQKLHLYPGFEKAEFEVILTEDECCRFITTLATAGSISNSEGKGQTKAQ